MKESVFFLKSKDSHEIPVYLWQGEGEIKAFILLIHGMSEHALRYRDFAQYFTKASYAVISCDLRGHGKASLQTGKGHFADENGTELILEDLKILSRFCIAQSYGKAVFLLGHSMGSFFAQALAREEASSFAGLVLSGSTFISPFESSLMQFLAKIETQIKGKRKASKLLAHTFKSYNRKIPGAKNPFTWLSTDEKEVYKYLKDEFCGFACSNASWHDLMRLLKKIYSFRKISEHEKNLNVLLLSGEKDPMGGSKFKTLFNFYKKLSFQNVKSKEFEAMRHEIFNEKDKLQVFLFLKEYLDDLTKM